MWRSALVEQRLASAKRSLGKGRRQRELRSVLRKVLLRQGCEGDHLEERLSASLPVRVQYDHSGTRSLSW
jgi:hypothetical protein